MRVAIVGAGAAGLASARQLSGEGIHCEVFEMSAELGGVWVFNPNTGTDEYGFPIYNTMYKNLRTNLPKEIMCFPDYPMLEQCESFPTQPEVLEFLNKFADHFDIRKLIKFNRMVTHIRPLGNKWRIKSIDKTTRNEFASTYEAVMICSGHHNEPVVPKLPGQELFAGVIQHSQQYRSCDPFKNQKVLIIGAGPSALEIALQISEVAQKVVLSHHSSHVQGAEFPSNVSKKPDVLRIKSPKEVEFIDGSSEDFDSISLCTGYKYSFPFLDESCGVSVRGNDCVQPLYKQMINIEGPTMCFIGLQIYVNTFHLFDIQARFFCEFLKGSFKLPSREAMLLDREEDMRNRLDNKMKPHYLGENQQQYFDDLAKMANIATIKPVFSKLWDEVVDKLLNDVQNFRDAKYKIIDSENFIKIY